MKFARCRWHGDKHGRLVELDVENAPNDALVVAKLLQREGQQYSFLKSRAQQYADESGNFVCFAPVRDQRAQLYVPWGAVVVAPSQGSHLIAAVGLERDASDALVAQRFELKVKTHDAYSRVDILRPLIGLAVAVAYADGSMTGSEVRCLKEVLATHLGVPKSEFNALKKLMYKCPEDDVALLACAALYRANIATPELLVRFLEMIARADGKVTRDELRVITAVSNAVHAPPNIIDSVRALVAPESKDPHEVLKLKAGATPDEIRKAYKKVVAAFHPDKIQHLDEEFRAFATQKIIEATAAYEALQAPVTEAEEPGRPRPTERTNNWTYGVRAQIKWHHAKPETLAINTRPAPLPPPPPDPLAGAWMNHQGRWVFTPNGAGRYQFEEFGVLGRCAQGVAFRNGNVVDLEANNILVGSYTGRLHINGATLSGTVNVGFAGFRVPGNVLFMRG